MADQQTPQPSTGNHPAHDKADEVSRRVPEIAALYRSIGMRSYWDNDHLRLGVEPNVERKKNEIDDILWTLKYNEVENQPNTNHFKEGAVELAQKYLKANWLHTPWLTSRILTQLLDSELVPLKSEAYCAEFPGRFTSLLPGLWGVIVPATLSSIYLVALSVIAFFLFSSEHTVFGWFVVTYTLWHFGNRLRHNVIVYREWKRLQMLHAQLNLVRGEVASGSYDPVELEHRLRRSEELGLYVHSLTYGLLKAGRDATIGSSFPCDTQ